MWQSFIWLERYRPNLALYPRGPRATSTLSYLSLLRVRFVKPADYPTAGALLPRLSTLAPFKIEKFFISKKAVSVSMTLSSGLLPPDVIRHAALWSPDFPRPKIQPRLPRLPAAEILTFAKITVNLKIKILT